jgi:CubicO group peptidase (beta-lactamase class C family)
LDSAVYQCCGRNPVDGYLHPDFSLIGEVLRGQLAGGSGGASLCVYHRGKKVVDVWGGARDEWGTPWGEDTMSPSFSTSKGVASTTLHALADKGLLPARKASRCAT